MPFRYLCLLSITNDPHLVTHGPLVNSAGRGWAKSLYSGPLDLTPASSWHVVRTRYGAESRVVQALARVLDGAFTPMRRGEAGLAPLWSGYIFGRWRTEDAHLWHDVRDSTDVRGILHANGDLQPMPVSPLGLVDGWLAIADPDGIVPGLEPPAKVNGYGLLIGKTVMLREGMTGKVLRIDDRAWAVCRTELLGRRHDVAVPAGGLIPLGEDGQPHPRRRGGFLRMRRERSSNASRGGRPLQDWKKGRR